MLKVCGLAKGPKIEGVINVFILTIMVIKDFMPEMSVIRSLCSRIFSVKVVAIHLIHNGRQRG